MLPRGLPQLAELLVQADERALVAHAPDVVGDDLRGEIVAVALLELLDGRVDRAVVVGREAGDPSPCLAGGDRILSLLFVELGQSLLQRDARLLGVRGLLGLLLDGKLASSSQ